MRLLFCALLLKVMATGLPQGRLLKDGISAWLGVRYADQPERFQRASLANDWKDEPGNSMDKPAKACPQAKFFPGLETSEDCLFLNVFGPTNPPSASSLLPVIVYIHGGAYKFGSGNEFTVENLGNLSSHDNVIVVTVQYRLSVLGFFYPHFPSSKFHPNLGLDDTHLAIKFISKNIHEFGGDPSQITLIGHSAGACSAHALAISTAVDQGLFKRVILMSGVLEICFNGTGSPASPSAIAAKELCNANLYDPYDKEFEELLYKCLTKAPLEALEQIDLKQEKNWVLFADGYYFPKSGHESMDRSSRGHEFLIGLTTGEWAFFENLFAKYMGRTDYSSARFRKTITAYMGISDDRLDTLENFYTQKYDPKLYSTRTITSETVITAEQWFWFEVVVNSMTDLVFHVPIVSEVEKLRNARVPPSLFVYTYNATLAARSWDENRHASHSDELPWLFGDLKKIITESPGYRKVLLFFAKNGQLGNFATTGIVDDSRPNNTVLFENVFYYHEANGIDGFCPRARDLMQTLGISKNESQGPKREFDCGKTSVDPISWNFGSRKLKIHQGVDSRDSSYPYFVRVEHVDETTNLKTNCGGSYIAPKWVMTAASCVRKNVRWYYYLSYRFRQGNKVEIQAQSQTARVWEHGDVALLELETDIDTSDDFGRRVCLEARGLTLKEPMIAFGMGDGEKAKVQEAVLRADCLDEQDTFCGRGKATTKGDSGGPLVAKYGPTWYQVGIMSDSSSLGYTKATPVTRKLCEWLNQETKTIIC